MFCGILLYRFSNSKEEELKLAPVLELEKQLHEKDMELTDVRLEALASAHKLDQMQNNLTRMKVVNQLVIYSITQSSLTMSL